MPKNLYITRTACSFLIVLLLMPLGHAMMILMEHCLSQSALHYSAFAMGFAGMCIVIRGIFVKNDTKATILGLSGGLLFWTGWVEFLFSYYAWRYGVHCDLLGTGVVQSTTEYIDGFAISHDMTINDASIGSYDRAALKAMRGSRPEYLIMPATFGMWMMLMMLYTLCTRTGCRFFNWVQRTLNIAQRIDLKPITRLPAMVTFMELNAMMWSCYLLLMFCYDPEFIGSEHWITIAVALGCFIGSIFMLRKQLRLKPWGANIRMAIATVIVFWTFVEIIARNGWLKEIWIDPLNHTIEMTVMTASIFAIVLSLIIKSRRASHSND